jgi:hypothetical protein
VGKFDEQPWGISASVINWSEVTLSRDTQIGPLSFNPARSVILSVWLAQDHDR